jgi:hypothetical protein
MFVFAIVSFLFFLNINLQYILYEVRIYTSLVMIPRQVCINMVMIPMFHGDNTNATSRLNSTSQTEVSTKREYSLGGIFSPKI